MSWLFTGTIPVCEQTEIQLACLSLKDLCGGYFSKLVDSSSLILLLKIHQQKEVSSSQDSNLRGPQSALAAHY